MVLSTIMLCQQFVISILHGDFKLGISILSIPQMMKSLLTARYGRGPKPGIIS